MNERRPAARVLRFLADSRDGLDRLIKESTADKEVVSIKRHFKGSNIMFGAHVAEVVWRPRG
jgi:hypothetical protein